MKSIIFLVIPVIFFLSCKKETGKIDISGQLFDPNAGNYVAGATVSIQANGVVDGVYNAGYNTITSGRTDADGKFSFTIDESAYDSFRFTFVKDGYYISEEIKSAGSIDPENPFSGSFNIYSKSILKVRVQNATPFDALDEITFFFSNPPSNCSECCYSDPIQMHGMNIDSTIYCSSYGSYNLIINYSYTKNSANFTYNDTILTVPFDTTYYIISF